MKRLIIPDIHHKIDRVDRIVELEEPDQIIMLGDYFDDFGDTIFDTARTAEWLAGKLEDVRYVCLMGNHDQAYIFPKLRCSGWTLPKQNVITSILTERHWHKMFPCYSPIDSKYLFSHAGVHPHFLHNLGIITLPGVERVVLDRWIELWDTNYSTLFDAGHDRGGTLPHGGITWGDFRKFEGLIGIPQIVGHTQQPTVRIKDITPGGMLSYCLDTNLQHYALLNDTALTIKEVPDGIK